MIVYHHIKQFDENTFKLSLYEKKTQWKRQKDRQTDRRTINEIAIEYLTLVIFLSHLLFKNLQVFTENLLI